MHYILDPLYIIIPWKGFMTFGSNMLFVYLIKACKVDSMGNRVRMYLHHCKCYFPQQPIWWVIESKYLLLCIKKIA